METPAPYIARTPVLDGDAALVVFSGGQDSTTCLYWALKRFSRVEAVTFDYGQRHRVEIEQARIIADLAGVPHHVVPVPGVLGGSTITDEPGSTERPHTARPDLPSSFTPGRNAVFLAIAASLAYNLRCRTIVTGVSQADYSGYPDCRGEFIASMETALSAAVDEPLSIETPLLDLSKAETWALANELGCLYVVVEHSHTDYHGDRSERHAWGYGRLDNPASILRAKGFEEARAKGWI